MPKVRVISTRGTVQRYSEAVPLLKQPGDTVVVMRGQTRSIVMQCPEGCGDLITINLDRRSGPAWRVYERSGRLTIYPSVWRENGCGAHFIVWNNQIVWCDVDETAAWNDPGLVTDVERALPPVGKPHRHYEDIAAELSVVPWEVLWACQSLVRSGLANSSDRGTKFGATPTRPRSRSGINIKV